MPESATRPRPKADTTCPTCGAPAETGQLICLECGSRITLSYRRPPSWRVPAAIVSVIVLAAAAGIYLGLQGLEDDADQEVAAQPAPSEAQPESTGGEEESGDAEGGGGQNSEAGDGDQAEEGDKSAKKEEAAENKEPAGEGTEAPAAGAGGVRSWGEGEDAYTVVILASEDQRSARAFAQNAVKAGTPAGVLRADDYPSLSASTGFFIVFVGTYPNQVKADAAAARLGRRFAGSYPQFVNGSKATR